jgi:hypothetical protein
MSKENVTAFFQKMQTDETLKKQFASIQSELQQQMMTQLADKVVTLGADSGLEFTTDELHDMYKDMTDQMSENRELSDDEVDAISGGAKTPGAAIATSVASFGLGCALISVTAEMTGSGECGKAMTTANCE